MTFEIEFEDQGQDLLRLTCHEDTGEILSAEPYHGDLYVDGKHFVDVERLYEDRMVGCTNIDGQNRVFRWPMVKLSLNGDVLASA